jgi:hypothetical protein
VIDKIRNWFFTTWLGDLYFRFLLWRDSKQTNVRYLTPQEAITITRQYSLLHRGVTEVKKQVNELVKSKSAEEYDQTLKKIENMLQFADRAPDSAEARLADVLRSMQVKKGNKDIVTHTDHAKMIQGRIDDYKELQDHVVRRTLMRDIRKAKASGDQTLVSKLEKEWKEKYGR